MAWSGNNDTLNQFTPHNYMYGTFVFLFDEITQDTCFSLLGDITNFVMSEHNKGTPLNIVINSPGGDVSTMTTFLGLLNIAKLNGIPIRTYVLGTAASAASVIASQGDERFMSNISYHFVHFGTHVSVASKPSEIDKIYIQTKEYAKVMDDLYVQASEGKMTKQLLNEIQKDERGYLNAQSCLKYGLCDRIIENDLNSLLAAEKKINEQKEAFLKFRSEQKAKNKSKDSTKKGKKQK